MAHTYTYIYVYVYACVHAGSLQSCTTLYNPMDYSLPCSSVHGILQARRLEWIAVSFSRGSSPPKDQTDICYVSCIGRWLLYHWSHIGNPDMCTHVYVCVCVCVCVCVHVGVLVPNIYLNSNKFYYSTTGHMIYGKSFINAKYK